MSILFSYDRIRCLSVCAVHLPRREVLDAGSVKKSARLLGKRSYTCATRRGRAAPSRPLPAGGRDAASRRIDHSLCLVVLPPRLCLSLRRALRLRLRRRLRVLVVVVVVVVLLRVVAQLDLRHEEVEVLDGDLAVLVGVQPAHKLVELRGVGPAEEEERAGGVSCGEL